MRLPLRLPRESLSFRAPRRGPFLQVAKSAIAMIAAWVAAGALVPGPPPIFAAIAAVLVVQPSINQSFTRAVYDGYTASIADDPSVRAIAEQLHRAAHDVRLDFALDPRTEPEPIAEEPALTRPLQIRTPSTEHWVLVGSLLMDLHRIHESLRDEQA